MRANQSPQLTTGGMMNYFDLVATRSITADRTML